MLAYFGKNENSLSDKSPTGFVDAMFKQLPDEPLPNLPSGTFVWLTFIIAGRLSSQHRDCLSVDCIHGIQTLDVLPLLSETDLKSLPMWLCVEHDRCHRCQCHHAWPVFKFIKCCRHSTAKDGERQLELNLNCCLKMPNRLYVHDASHGPFKA